MCGETNCETEWGQVLGVCSLPCAWCLVVPQMGQRWWRADLLPRILKSWHPLMQKTHETCIGQCCSSVLGMTLHLNTNLTCCVKKVTDLRSTPVGIAMLHREGDILTRHSMLHLYIWMVDVSWLCHWWDRPVLASSDATGTLLLLVCAELFHQVHLKSGCIAVDKLPC